MTLGEYVLPDFPTEGLSIEDFLVKVSEEGLEERLEFFLIKMHLILQKNENLMMNV